MLGRSLTKPLELRPADETSERLFATFGLSTEPKSPGPGGLLFTFARVTVRRDALWFEHFNADSRLLGRMRFV